MQNRKTTGALTLAGIAAVCGLMLRPVFMPRPAQAQNAANSTNPARRAAMNPETMQKLADETEIRRVVDEIDNAVDEKDWTTCRSYFLDDIDVDFSSLTGTKAGRIKADQLVGGWQKSLYADKKSLHIRSNHRITITGDTAAVMSKGYALNILPGKLGSDLWEVWGIYHHTLTRTAQGWRVSGMTLTVTHARGNERARDYIPPAS